MSNDKKTLDIADDAIEHIIQAAEDHAEDTCEPEHQIGDLEDALRTAWSLMNAEQRQAFMDSDSVQNLLSLTDE